MTTAWWKDSSPAIPSGLGGDVKVQAVQLKAVLRASQWLLVEWDIDIFYLIFKILDLLIWANSCPPQAGTQRSTRNHWHPSILECTATSMKKAISDLSCKFDVLCEEYPSCGWRLQQRRSNWRTLDPSGPSRPWALLLTTERSGHGGPAAEMRSPGEYMMDKLITRLFDLLTD